MGFTTSAATRNGNQVASQLPVPNVYMLKIRLLDAAGRGVADPTIVVRYDSKFLLQSANDDTYLLANNAGYRSNACICCLGGNLPYFERPNTGPQCPVEGVPCFGNKNWAIWGFSPCQPVIEDGQVRYGDRLNVLSFSGVALT